MMDKTQPFPVEWNAWRDEWKQYRAELESRSMVYRFQSDMHGPSPFKGVNIMADEMLGVWVLGPLGTDGALQTPVELSEVTFTLGGDHVRYIGITIGESGPGGDALLASTFEELDDILAPLAWGRHVNLP